MAMRPVTAREVVLLRGPSTVPRLECTVPARRQELAAAAKARVGQLQGWQVREATSAVDTLGRRRVWGVVLVVPTPARRRVWGVVVPTPARRRVSGVVVPTPAQRRALAVPFYRQVGVKTVTVVAAAAGP
jgi:hypothetical protein